MTEYLWQEDLHPMFFCEECRKENGFQEGFSFSHGVCEICNKKTKCYEVPSKYLKSTNPKPKTLTRKKVKTEYRYELTHNNLYQALKDYIKIPDGAEFSFSVWVPGGGDWSNSRLEIDNETTLDVVVEHETVST